MPQFDSIASVRVAVHESYFAKLERRREQCRENQARYRRRQHEHLLKMETDTATLRVQSENLAKLRQDMT